MLESIGKDAKRKRLHPFNGFLSRRTIGKRAWQVHYLGDPSSVVFSFYFNGKHGRNLSVRA